MSTCISREGEFGEHEYGATEHPWADSRALRFVCCRCGVYDEDAVLAALDAAGDALAAEKERRLWAECAHDHVECYFREEKAGREEAERKYQRERSMKGQWRKKVRDLETALSEQCAVTPKITETVEDSRTPAPEGYSAGHWYQVARKWERYAHEWERIALAHKDARDKAEQERDEARQYAEAESATRVNLANRVTELQNLLRFDQSDLRDAVESLEAAEARAAELEAGINALADELESGHVPDSVTDLTPLGLAPMVRALSRKRT